MRFLLWRENCLATHSSLPRNFTQHFTALLVLPTKYYNHLWDVWREGFYTRRIWHQATYSRRCYGRRDLSKSGSPRIERQSSNFLLKPTSGNSVLMGIRENFRYRVVTPAANFKMSSALRSFSEMGWTLESSSS